MSRVIKFRVWHPVAGKLFYQSEKENVFSGTEFPNGGDWLLSLPRQPGNFSPELNGRAFSWCEGQIWEQFIGLTDKNGKEIYEGDFLRVNGESYAPLSVRYREDIAGFSLGNHPVHPCFRADLHILFDTTDSRTNLKLEVIGNIHENQDLLEP